MVRFITLQMYSFCQHKFTDEQKSFLFHLHSNSLLQMLYILTLQYTTTGVSNLSCGPLLALSSHRRATLKETHKKTPTNISKRVFFFLNFKYCIRQNCKRECSFSPQILSNKKSNFKIYIRAVSRGGRKFHTPALSFT